MVFSQIADCTALYNRLHPASLEKPQGQGARGAATASVPSPLPCGLSSDVVSEPQARPVTRFGPQRLTATEVRPV